MACHGFLARKKFHNMHKSASQNQPPLRFLTMHKTIFSDFRRKGKKKKKKELLCLLPPPLTWAKSPRADVIKPKESGAVDMAHGVCPDKKLAKQTRSEGYRLVTRTHNIKPQEMSARQTNKKTKAGKRKRALSFRHFLRGDKRLPCTHTQLEPPIGEKKKRPAFLFLTSPAGTVTMLAENRTYTSNSRFLFSVRSLTATTAQASLLEMPRHADFFTCEGKKRERETEE